MTTKTTPTTDTNSTEIEYIRGQAAVILPERDASKAAEILFIEQVATHMPEGPYLKDLFTPEMVAWVTEQIRNDFVPDLYDWMTSEAKGRQDAKKELSDAKVELELARTASEARIASLTAQLEAKNQTIDRLHSEQDEWAKMYAARSDENTSNQARVEELEAQVNALKVELFDTYRSAGKI